MVLAPVVLIYPSNPEFSASLLLGAIIYLIVYTIWLKPRTPLNIVIGGAAGSCAVISGAASVGLWDHPGALLLALLLFCWTPIHFWSLAIVYAQDYKRARIPMLPVTSSPQVAAAWGLVHGVGAAISGLALALVPGLGPVYAIPAAVATAALLWQGWLLVQDASPKRAWRLFHTSNLYLFVTLIALCLASLLQMPWP